MKKLFTCSCDVVHLLLTKVLLVRLGENSDEHGEGAIVVEDAEHEPDPAEDDQTVLVEHDQHHCRNQTDGQKILAHVQPPFPVGEIIQDNVRQWLDVGNPLVGEDKACCGGQEASAHEEKGDQ